MLFTYFMDRWFYRTTQHICIVYTIIDNPVSVCLSCSPDRHFFGTEQVTSAKLLGVIFKGNRSFDEHVTTVLIYLYTCLYT